MKKVFKFGASLLGAMAVLTGANSCSKDDDGPECCEGTGTYTYSGITVDYSMEVCDDGTYEITASAGGQTITENGEWDSYYDSWSEAKAAVCD